MAQSLFYRRPPLVSTSQDSLNKSPKPFSSDVSVSTNCSCGIPDALTFDRIISGGTCPPCTIRDFMNYLKYIERSAENLQFYLWLRDYSARFDRLPDSEKRLSPVWTKADADAALKSTPRKGNVTITDLFKETTLDEKKPQITERVDPFDSPITPSLDESQHSDADSSLSDTRTATSPMASPEISSQQAFDHAGLPLMPFTTQPYRDEIMRIITVYITDDAPRQLNLSSRERQTLLRALQRTTHPSAFQEILLSIEWTLRKQSHPNFIRWTICNGNRSRVIFARGLGIFLIVVGIVADLLITLSHAGRAWRVLPFVALLLGISTLIAAWKGMCVVLHGLHHRHLRPWELFSDDAVDEEKASRDSITSSTSNSWEDEPWIPQYEKRNVIRKIFDKEVWIQEPALRQIQDAIFLQAMICSFILSCVLTGIFCAVPAGNLF